MRHVASTATRCRRPLPPPSRWRAPAAADYTLAKGRFGLLSHGLRQRVLLGWTLLGGLDLLNAWLRDTVLPAWGAMAYQLALLAAFTLIGALLELPLRAGTAPSASSSASASTA
jgi:STE24 endopeptidase